MGSILLFQVHKWHKELGRIGLDSKALRRYWLHWCSRTYDSTEKESTTLDLYWRPQGKYFRLAFRHIWVQDLCLQRQVHTFWVSQRTITQHSITFLGALNSPPITIDENTYRYQKKGKGTSTSERVNLRVCFLVLALSVLKVYRGDSFRRLVDDALKQNKHCIVKDLEKMKTKMGFEDCDVTVALYISTR
jgi:hypothetical protein